ncbi:uncharacterized protein LOC112568071 isoform X2 [Pomacea canaliculata]|uniref:uncharacterized protein LOC112568071 isoform X2 n=1 Tax=Pomacea canaliculata TaxID=400727 RepID=UPI000D733974|nr:uncharacterized protein LOC112568071 isoform X2 [Pomacea canaliculata]
MTFIRDQFRELGLETHIHTFSTALRNVTGVNVIGLLKGRNFNTPDDSVVGVTAHHDTIRTTPGVNNNGAGVVAMLEVAREVSKQPNRIFTVLFMCIDFKEAENSEDSGCKSGQCGLQALAREWLPNFWPKTVNCILVLDSILNFDDTKKSQNFTATFKKLFPAIVKNVESNEGPGDFLAITGRSHDAPLATLFKDTWNSMGDDKYKIQDIVLPSSVPNPATEKTLQPFSEFLLGTHTTFWLRGDRAVFLSDTAENRGSTKQCYHMDCDNMNKVSEVKIGFIAKTARTLISVVNSMAPVSDLRGPYGGSTHLEPLFSQPTISSYFLPYSSSD